MARARDAALARPRNVRWLMLARNVAFVGFLTTFFSSGALEMSWAGRRPFSPDATHPRAIMNHGLMFVSDSDLMWLWALTLVAMAFLALYAILYEIGAKAGDK